MTHPDIVRAIQSIVAQGKTPSLALLKSRLGGAAPMPALIQALRQYKLDPAVFEPSSKPVEEQQPESRNSECSKQGEPTMQLLLDEIRALRSEVAALRKEVRK